LDYEQVRYLVKFGEVNKMDNKKFKYIGNSKYWDEKDEMWVVPGQEILGSQRILKDTQYRLTEESELALQSKIDKYKNLCEKEGIEPRTDIDELSIDILTDELSKLSEKKPAAKKKTKKEDDK